MRQLDLDKKDAVQWYQDKFGISSDKKDEPVAIRHEQPKETSEASKEARERVISKWERLESLDQHQIDYLASR